MLRFRFACFDELFICPVYINCTLVIYVPVFGNLEFINVVKVRTYDIIYIELNVYKTSQANQTQDTILLGIS